MTEKQSKFSSPYSLVKNPIQQNRLYSLYNARNKSTGEFWLAKVFRNEVISQHQLTDHIQYNEEVLQNLNSKEHIIYVPEIFVRGDETFMIQEKYQIKLSDYISAKKTLPSTEIERILKDVFEGICDIYEESYVHRNLRSDQIVKVIGKSPEQYSWKIEALVLNSKEFSIDTPFTWRRDSASAEDISERQSLDEQMEDAQIVWNFAFLGMEMLLGSQFVLKKGTKDSDIPWQRVKEWTSDSPCLFQLLDRGFRAKYKDRLTLKNFFALKLFYQVSRPGIAEHFMTASKIFKVNVLSHIGKSMNMKGIKSARFQSKIAGRSVKTGEAYFQKIEQVEQQVYDQTDNKDATRFRFLLEVNKYLNFIISDQPPNKQNQNRIIIEFFYLKLALMFQEKARKQDKNAMLESLEKQSLSKIQNHSKSIRRIKESDNKLVKRFALDTKKDYNLEQLISVFNKLNGYAYSRVQQVCETNENEKNLKALSYFGLLAYLINFNQWEDMESLRGSAHSEYLSKFDNTKVDDLIKFTQNLIKQHFETE